MEKWGPEAQAGRDALCEALNKDRDALGLSHALYRRSAGEAEARNVPYRKDLTPAERRAKASWETQDVPDDQQIVRFR
jgi:hypothetical protein